MEPTHSTPMEPSDPAATPQPTTAAPSPSNRQKTLFLSFAGFVAVATIAISIGLAWSGRTQVHASDLVRVNISQNGFGPATIHIQKGQSVTWVNTGTSAHEVIADSKTSGTGTNGFDSQPLGLNDSYTVTFDKAGTYTYYDASNPFTNKGQVTVE